MSVTSEAGATGKPNTVVAAELPIWTAGRISAQIQASSLDVAAQSEALRESQYDLALRVINAWQSFAQAEQRKRVYLSVKEKLDQYQALMTRRVQANVSARIELELILTRASQIKVDLRTAEVSRQVARDRLRYLVGDALSLDEVLASSLDSSAEDVPAIAWTDQSAQFAAAVEAHPSVRKSLRQADAVAERAAAKAAARWPAVYMRLQRLTSATAPLRDSVFFGIKYEPGAGWGSTALAQAAQNRAQGALIAVDAIRREVSDALQAEYKAMLSARDRSALLGFASTSSLLVVESYERQFIAGRRSWQEVLNALRERSDYSVAYADSRSESMAGSWRVAIRGSELAWQKGN